MEYTVRHYKLSTLNVEYFRKNFKPVEFGNVTPCVENLFLRRHGVDYIKAID